MLTRRGVVTPSEGRPDRRPVQRGLTLTLTLRLTLPYTYLNPHPKPNPNPNPNPNTLTLTLTLGLTNPNPKPNPNSNPSPNPNQVYYDAAGDVQKNVVSDLTYPPDIRAGTGAQRFN